jgi:hypothetical protein
VVIYTNWRILIAALLHSIAIAYFIAVMVITDITEKLHSSPLTWKEITPVDIEIPHFSNNSVKKKSDSQSF